MSLVRNQDVLWEASERYYGSNHYGIRPNYERVLGEMTSLASWLSPRPFGNPIIEAIRGGSPVAALEWLHDPSDENTGRKLVLSQQTFLLEKLANYIRGLTKPIDSRSPPIPDYMNFLRTLQDCFDLGIYNLNYDTAARSAWPEAYCGFDRHVNFDPSGVTQRRKWDFVYHLHGSVRHCITAYPHRIGWKEDLDCEFTDKLEMAPDMAQDFRSVPLTTLIAGGFKLDQLLARDDPCLVKGRADCFLELIGDVEERVPSGIGRARSSAMVFRGTALGSRMRAAGRGGRTGPLARS